MEFTSFFNVNPNKLTIDGMYICCETISGETMLEGAVLEANAFEMTDSDVGIARNLHATVRFKRWLQKMGVLCCLDLFVYQIKLGMIPSYPEYSKFQLRFLRDRP